MHVVLPWARPSHGSYLSQGSPSGGVGTSRVRLPPTGTRTMALKPPFSSLYYCSEALRPPAVSPPPWSFLPMGIRGWHRRCLNLAMPHLGDALTWRRLILATLTPGDALSGQPVDFLPLGPLEGSQHMLTLTWLWLWSTLGDGTVQYIYIYVYRHIYLTNNFILTKLIILPIFNYSPSGLPLKLGRAHDPPFGPKTELIIPKYLDRGPEHTSTPVQYTNI